MVTRTNQKQKVRVNCFFFLHKKLGIASVLLIRFVSTLGRAGLAYEITE